jgi:phosphoribosylformimino-5-aminoimidazole carboxamide ribotide isomerase
MKIYPAIDLIGGEVVRLHKGKFDEKTVYSKDPIEVAKNFEQMGAESLHVVDLDAANGKARQLSVLETLAANTNLKIQFGGGVRSKEDITQIISLGAERVIVGSYAVSNPNEVKDIIYSIGSSRITIGMDLMQNDQGEFEIATHAWTKSSGLAINKFIEAFGVSNELAYLVTDISKDGTLAGPNFDLYKRLLSEYPGIQLEVSGGVSNIDDVKKANSLGVYGIIIGKAYYEGKLDLKETLLLGRT